MINDSTGQIICAMASLLNHLRKCQTILLKKIFNFNTTFLVVFFLYKHKIN